MSLSSRAGTIDRRLFPSLRRRGGRPFAWIVLAVALLPGAAGTAAANGWEHTTVPLSALVKALDYEQPGIRARAAQSLGFRGQREAFEPLVRRLDAPEEDPLVRGAIYAALGQLGDPRALPVLGRCLDEETRAELRADCARSLGEVGGPAALERLLAALEEDASALVRSRVVDALGAYRDERAVSALAALVRGGRNRSLRNRAIRSLGRAGGEEAARILLAALARADRDRDRARIVAALGEAGAPAATRPLTRLLEKTDDPALRVRIVVALGAIRDGSAFATLVGLLDDPLPAVRYYAVGALRDLGRPEAAGPILALSLRIGGRTGPGDGRAAADPFADPLRTLADLSLQEVALRALVELDPETGLPAFLDAAARWDLPRDSSLALRIAEAVYTVRRVALYGLGYTASRRAADLLAGPLGLGDPDFRLRAVAVRSLGVLGFPDSVPRVLAALRDEAAEVRWTAAAVLGRLGDRRAVAPLIDLLDDENAEARRQAALGLGYLGASEAADALARLRDGDGDARVRAAAGYAVTLLDGAR